MTADLFSATVFLRLALAIGIILLGVLLFRLMNTLLLARVRFHARLPQTQPNAGPQPAATLLYFTTPACAPCKTVQRPVIQQVREQVGEALIVIEIDASRQPEVASQWGVLSVPTTFVLDASGSPRYVNHGVASADKLLQQINGLG